MPNTAGLKPFTKGDKRINRKGRPRGFKGLRALAQQIAHRDLPGNPNGISITEAILTNWAASKDPRLQIHFMEIAYGKVPAPLELSGPKGERLGVSGDQFAALADKAKGTAGEIAAEAATGWSPDDVPQDDGADDDEEPE